MNPQKSAKLIQNAYAKSYGVKNVNKAFVLNAGRSNVAVGDDGTFKPTPQTAFISDVHKANAFLSRINNITRTNLTGGSFGLQRSGLVTSTTDTFNGDKRVPTPLGGLHENQYKMEKAHFDFSIHDDDLADLAEFPNFLQEYRKMMLQAYANDRLTIGVHGVEFVKTSDKTENQLGQDVNKGWFQQLRERASQQIHTGKDGVVQIGKGGQYANLDHLMQDLYQMIPYAKRQNMEGVVGESLLGMSEGTYFAENAMTPTEKQQIKNKAVSGVYGGLPVSMCDSFFNNGLFITSLATDSRRGNLSVYTQKDSAKRKIQYKAELEQLIDWNASRQAYHIEDLEKIALLDIEELVFLDIKDPDGQPIVVNKYGMGASTGTAPETEEV